ncbi:hypothetical protein [Thiomonas arsenitoxydans]|uniref:ADP-ribosyl-(Dinitrogen reductase) hydrolase n=1 Tax=Thiomonas arsenitoxydans (strain DSM 22701 / CIP 110005 / 3As) TaxID=426114 RepID=D6CTT5_THIA3|nr:hypothetical protein [Thiomonas arsenitoxydans]CAZ88704.1 conserved hypothetical protein [Thiomonas arsenitoxydans]
MEALLITPEVLAKIEKKHFVERKEIEQCFLSRDGGLLTDDREQHRTDPPTQWFLARTNRGRLLKIVFVQNGPTIQLKTAYEPNRTEIDIYRDKASTR